MEIRCYDVAEMVTDEASSQFGSLWKVNKEKQRVFHNLCDEIDKFAAEFNGSAFEVEVDDELMTITVSLICPEIVIRSNTHKFYSVIQRAAQIAFRKGDDDDICVDFMFPSIWEKA